MKFGSCTTSPEELSLFGKYGYALFESNFQRIREMSNEELDELQRAVQEHGVQMEGMNCFARYEERILLWSDEQLDEYFESGVKRAKPLGLKYVVIGSGGARKLPDGMPREQGEKRFVEVLRRFGAIAERYDIEVYLEALREFETNMINTVTEAVEICRKVAHPRVFCVADFYHMSCAGEPFKHIVDNAAYIRHIHVSTEDRRIPICKDREQLLKMIEQLQAMRYDGRVVLEGGAQPDVETALREFSEQFALFE